MSFWNKENKESLIKILANTKKKEEPMKLIDNNKPKNIIQYPDLPIHITEKDDTIPNYEENKNFKQIKSELNKASNFIDYFVEIGVDPSIYKKGWLYNNDLEELNKNEELQPKIISYFPPFEKETISFDESIIKHCFPNGYHLIKSNVEPNHEIFSFILDNNYFNLNYPQKYLSCIIFYESILQYKEIYDQNLIFNNKEEKIINKEFSENQEEIYIPKCLLIMSLYPFFSEFENILLKIYEYSLGKIKLYEDEKLKPEKTLVKELQNNYVEDDTKELITKCKKFERKRSKSFTNINLEENNKKNSNKVIISNINQNLINNAPKTIKETRPKTTRKKNTQKLKVVDFVPNIFSLLNSSMDEQEEEDNTNKNINNIKKYTYSCYIPIDKFIENLLIELPVPPRGKTEIRYNLMNEERKLYQNKMNDLPLIDINLKNLFVKFSVEKIIDIYRYLFLETRVLFFSENIDILNIFIYGLLSLLYPFEYQYQIITILPKENFEILESITPFIAGVNQKYENDFFEKLNLTLSDFILVADLDKCELKYINNENNIPDFPKNNKKQLDKKLHDILNKSKYKNISAEKFKNKTVETFVIVENKRNTINTAQEHMNRIRGRKNTLNNTLLNESYKFNNFLIDYKFNSEISSAFFNFNASLLTNYSKFLDTSFYSSNVPPCLEVLFKVNDFLKEIPSGEKDFYDKFISETQLFGDYLYKRMIPKNSQEKIRVLLFDETINEYHKNIFGKNHQCVFINTNEYNFEEKYEIQKPREINNFETDFFLKNKILLLSYGIIIDDENKKINFRYPIFPKLLTHKFFLNNIQDYYTNSGLSETIDLINMDIISKSHLGRVAERQNDMKNYVNLCWLQMWAMTFWYCDKKEKKYRFHQLLNVINRTTSHEMEILNLLFDTLEKNGEEYMVLKLYDILLKLKLNPSFKVHNIVMKYLDKYKSAENININDILQKVIQKEIFDPNLNNKLNFKKRTLKSKYYKNILFEDVTFYAFDTCIYCQKVINLYKKCINLNEINRDIMWIKCENCGQYSLVKFCIQFGKEANKNGNIKFNTCKYDSVVLFSPYSLKMNYKSLLNDYGINVDLEELIYKYNNIFWNSIWYFKLYNLDCDFMLPYDKIYLREEFDTNIKVSTNIIFDE